jgi:Protein of unknown function (DUF3616)
VTKESRCFAGGGWAIKHDTIEHLAAALVFAALTATLALSATVAHAEAAAGTAWDEGPHFSGNNKTRESISGAACAPVAPPVCLAAMDEGQSAQFFAIEGRKLVPGRVIRLLPDQDGWLDFDEIDAEGAAYADGFFYIMGSHGLTRGDKFEFSRFFMFRFPVDPATGEPAFEFSSDKVAPEIARSHILRDVINSAPGDVGHYAEEKLGEDGGGVNLEGIAVKQNRMYLGFRGPSVDGRAFILSVNVDGVFAGRRLAPAIHSFHLGKDTGIRDLAVVRDGLLILAGPVKEPDSPHYAIYRWDPASDALKKLQDLEMPEDGAKAETLLVLEESDTGYRVLVMYDSIADGGPREYELKR